MSVNAENFTNASEQPDAENNNAIQNRISPDLIEERIWANFEDLNQQILNPTQLLNVLMHNNSANITPTASSRAHRPQTRPSFHRKARAARTSPDLCKFSS